MPTIADTFRSSHPLPLLAALQKPARPVADLLRIVPDVDVAIVQRRQDPAAMHSTFVNVSGRQQRPRTAARLLYHAASTSGSWRTHHGSVGCRSTLFTRSERCENTFCIGTTEGAKAAYSSSVSSPAAVVGCRHPQRRSACSAGPCSLQAAPAGRPIGDRRPP